MVAQEEIEENLRTCAQDIEACVAFWCLLALPCIRRSRSVSPMFPPLPYFIIPGEVQSSAPAQATNLHSLCWCDLGPNSLLGGQRADGGSHIAQ